MLRALLSTLIICAIFSSSQAVGQISDPLDTNQIAHESNIEAAASDQGKTEEEILSEAFAFQAEDRLLDYRSKLLSLVRFYPKSFMGHLLLSEYYLKSIGHFRLSLRYALKAEALFQEQNGKPPYYNNFFVQSVHSGLLLILSEIKLNLDNYEGALEIIEQMEDFGYYDTNLASSKAWILMKLNRIPEAIATAKAGLTLGASPSHILNVLGILLSLNDQREESIDTFRKAIDYELSLGSGGNAATPLNNVGEVYREIFREDEAILSWDQAVRLPDGCEHILPSLNLAVVHLEGFDLDSAEDALKNFESCFAKYPLRNDEEHKAIIHMARGRIALMRGDVSQAVEDFNIALNRQQWFGKIGTSKEDLEAGIRISLAFALEATNQVLAYKNYDSTTGKLLSLIERIKNKVNAKWQLRKARILLFKHLSNFEDLYARHSDSMLDYSWLGIVLRDLNTNFTKALLQHTEAQDRRPRAKSYYQLYAAENLLRHGKNAQAQALLVPVIKNARDPHDRAIKSNALSLLATSYDADSPEYQNAVLSIFEINPAVIKLRGLRLPVRAIELTNAVKKLADAGNFIWSSSSPWGIRSSENGGKIRISLIEIKSNRIIHTAEAASASKAYEQLTNTIFSF